MASEEAASLPASAVQPSAVAIGPAVWVPKAAPPPSTPTAPLSDAGRSALVQDGLVASEYQLSWDELDHHADSIDNDDDKESEDGTCRLHDSIILGEDDTVSQILQQKPELVDSLLKGGTRPLHLAADHGTTFVVALLLHHGADTESTDGDGRTALHLAAKDGNFEVTRLLLEAGANLEAVSLQAREKPLWLAAQANKENIVKMLLDKKAEAESLNAKTGTTALMEAVKSRNVDLVKMLLAHGADADADATPGNAEELPAADEYNEDTAGRRKGIEQSGIEYGIGHRFKTETQAMRGSRPPAALSYASHQPSAISLEPPHPAYHEEAKKPAIPSGSNSSRLKYQDTSQEYVHGPSFPQAVALEERVAPVRSESREEPSGEEHRDSVPVPVFDNDAQQPMPITAEHKLREDARSKESCGLLYFHDAVGRKYHFPFRLARTWPVSNIRTASHFSYVQANINTANAKVNLSGLRSC